MEAKDTVMSLEEYNRFTLELYQKRNWRNYCKADCLDHEFKADLEHQAEISFKAGQGSRSKEVKEWFESHGYLHLLEQYIGVGVWQALEKSLGSKGKVSIPE